jgi:hypothetical protein
VTDLLTITTGAPTGSPDVWPQLSAAPAFQWWTRIEPYYDSWLWESQPLFTAKAKVRRIVDPASGGMRTVQVPDHADPDSDGQRMWARSLTNPTQRRIMTTLAQAHTMSADQLHCWAGMSHGNTHRFTPHLFELGLTRRGRYQPGTVTPGRLPSLWSINHDGDPIGRWMAELPDADAAQVCGNDERRLYRTVHARHNVLAAELALRLMEAQPQWTAVSGERASNPVGLTGDDEADTQLLGDLTLWRSDGLRVIVELCASPDRTHLVRKMAKWGDWLGRDTLEHTGVVVVFVGADRTGGARFARQLRKHHAEVLNVGTLRVAGRVATPAQVQRARGRLLLATWDDWFPGPHRISAAGVAGTCAFTANGDTYHPVDLTGLGYSGIAWPTDAATDALTPPWAGEAPMHMPS